MLSQLQLNLLQSLRETPRAFGAMSPQEQMILGGTLRPEGQGFTADQLNLMAGWRLVISADQLALAREMIDPNQALDPLKSLPLGDEMAAKLHGLGYLPHSDPGQTVLTLPASLLTDMRPGDHWFGCALVLKQLPLIELGPEYFPVQEVES